MKKKKKKIDLKAKKNPEKDFDTSLYVIQDLLKELISLVIIKLS